MPRKPTLNQDQARVLQARTYISRHTKLFSLSNLTETWDISTSTMYRYDDPKYRTLSREGSRRTYEEEKALRVRDVCGICYGSIRRHPRCTDCEILMHDGTATCQSCIDSRNRKRIKHEKENQQRKR